MFLNVIKDSDKIEYLISPIHYNKETGIIEPVKAPDEEKSSAQSLSVIEHSYELLSYLRNFPGRTMKSIKLSLIFSIKPKKSENFFKL